MADNVEADAGSGGATFVTREIAHAGDTAQLSGVFVLGISGSEGSYTAAAIDGTAANGLEVDVTRVQGNVAITAAALPLPSGAATAANQATIVGHIDGLETSLTSDLGKIIDAESDHRAHVSHFGSLKSGPTIPVLKASFSGTSLDTTQWGQVTVNAASITIAGGMAQMACGTNAAGSTKLKSHYKGRFEAGQVSVFQAGVRAGTALANNVRIWGLMDNAEQEGLYFKWNGATFQVVARKGGVETAVASGSFNGDSSFTPADTNNTYRIEYSAGRAIFYSASGGKKNLLHQLVDTATPLVNDLDLGLYFENTNSGNTTDESMYVRGASSSVWGSLDRYNSGGGHLMANFDSEVALGDVTGYSSGTKFGRNPDIGTGTTPEDIWHNGGVYTGFNATANQNIQVLSNDANDRGALLVSRTATGGSRTTLVDSGATFVTTGVAAGDVLINDGKYAHGIIASVDSETQVTVHRMLGSHPLRKEFNANGDAYRIVNAIDTGAAVVKLEQLRNASFVEQSVAYCVLNGVTPVTVTGSYFRCTRARVITAGSSGVNEGTVTVRQATTTTNVMSVIPPNYGHSTNGSYTVPTGKTLLLKRARVSISRASGAAGSATIVIQIRPRGQAWNLFRIFEVQTEAPVDFTSVGGDIIPSMTDIRVRVLAVSDNSTIAECAFEYTERTE